MRGRKKAQLFDQIFVYVLMLVVFSSILLFGFVAIKKLLTQSEVIDATKFRSDMQGMVSSNIGYGTSEVKVISIPGDFKEVCFIDSCVYKNQSLPGYCAGTNYVNLKMNESSLGFDVQSIKLYNHPKIEEDIKGYTPSNMFLYPNGPNFYIGELQVSNYPNNCNPNDATCTPSTTQKYYDCMPVTQGQLKIKLKGLGNRVEVTYLPFVN